MIERTFVRLGAIVLILTATAKLLSASGTAHILDLPDPLLGLENRQELWLVAALELSVAGLLCSRALRPIKCLAAAWLGGSFLLYRVALALLKPGARCKCLGTLAERLHLDDRTAGVILTSIAAFLLVGGLWLLWDPPGTAGDSAPAPDKPRSPGI